MSEDDLLYLFSICKDESNKSKYRIKMGCVILNKGKRVGIGYNKVKSHPKWSNEDKQTIHAECDAIRSTCKERIRGSVAVIYRETKRGKPALARPCNNCMNELRKFGVKNIFYSIENYPYFIMEKI